MALSAMRTSPHSADFRPQMEHWMQSLKELGRVDIKKGAFRCFFKYITMKMVWFSFLSISGRQLCSLGRYQQLWTFLTKTLHDTCRSGQRVDLVCPLAVNDTCNAMKVDLLDTCIRYT